MDPLDDDELITPLPPVVDVDDEEEEEEEADGEEEEVEEVEDAPETFEITPRPVGHAAMAATAAA